QGGVGGLGCLRSPALQGRSVQRDVLLPQSGRLPVESQRPLGVRATVDVRDQAGDRLGTVGGEQFFVRALRDPCSQGHPALSRRLGSARGARLALLEGRDARVFERMVKRLWIGAGSTPAKTRPY